MVIVSVAFGNEKLSDPPLSQKVALHVWFGWVLKDCPAWHNTKEDLCPLLHQAFPINANALNHYTMDQLHLLWVNNIKIII